MGDGFASGEKLWRGRGCEKCHGTGFLGRLPLHELLLMDDELRQAILRKEDANAMEAMACRNGFRRMWEDGREKAVQGQTTMGEVRRVLYVH